MTRGLVGAAITRVMNARRDRGLLTSVSAQELISRVLCALRKAAIY
jgi:hypothetical protein